VILRLGPGVAALALAGLASGPASAETVRVFAASSLTEAFGEIAAVFEAGHPGTRVELSFAGSQVLRTQIEQGAPADVFASADREHTDALVRKGLLGPTRVFARNAVVVVTPAGAARVSSLADLARPGTRVVLAGPSVPAGRYAAGPAASRAGRPGAGSAPACGRTW
jgi:molybdate transport system substrate-binding protein